MDRGTIGLTLEAFWVVSGHAFAELSSATCVGDCMRILAAMLNRI